MEKIKIYTESKLIAEFMGFETQTDAVDDRTLAYYVGDVIKADNSDNENEDDVFHPEDMQFHKSWDWLMAVVEKIMWDNDIDDNDCTNIANALCDAKIDRVYNAVVEFINQYNK